MVVLAKDTKVTNNVLVTADGGQPVMTAALEYYIEPTTGALISRNGSAPVSEWRAHALRHAMAYIFKGYASAWRTCARTSPARQRIGVQVWLPVQKAGCPGSAR